MKVTIPMQFSKRTKRMTVFAAIDADAPIQTVYVNADWLRSQGGSEEAIMLTMSDEGTPEENEKGDPADAFDMFLDATVVRSGDCRMTTGHHLDCLGCSLRCRPCCGHHRRRATTRCIARLRECFSAPVAVRGRVDGRVQHYWKGYRIRTSSSV